MRIKSIIISAFLLLNIHLLLAQSPQWAISAGGNNSENENGVDIDDVGNTYITGKFYDNFSIGSFNLSSPQSWSAYLAKVDPSGQVLWARIAVSDSALYVGGICVQNNGNISITGRYTNTALFGDHNPLVLFSSGSFDAFVATYTNNGDALWAKSIGDTGIDYGVSINHDEDGNTYVIGEIHINSNPPSGNKIFVAKYDPAGTNVWLRTTLSYGNFQFPLSIATDHSGNSFVTGQYFHSMSFDSITSLIAGNVEANVFILKFDSAGNIKWMNTGGAATGYTGGQGIDIDANGNCYVTGFFKGTISLGPLSLTAASPYYESFIAKCDSNGNFIWAKMPWGLTSNDRGIFVDAADDGSCTIGGIYNSDLHFGNTVLTNTGNSNVYLAHTDPLGDFTWATSIGGERTISIGGLKQDSLNIYFAGSFTDTIHFDNSLSLIADTALTDIYISKFSNLVSEISNAEVSSNIKIYPNPAQSYLKLENSTAISYAIYDMLGILSQSGSLEANKLLNIPDLKSGVYILRLDQHGGTISNKFIVK